MQQPQLLQGDPANQGSPSLCCHWCCCCMLLLMWGVECLPLGLVENHRLPQPLHATLLPLLLQLLLELLPPFQQLCPMLQVMLPPLLLRGPMAPACVCYAHASIPQGVQRVELVLQPGPSKTIDLCFGVSPALPGELRPDILHTVLHPVPLGGIWSGKPVLLLNEAASSNRIRPRRYAAGGAAAGTPAHGSIWRPAAAAAAALCAFASKI